MERLISPLGSDPSVAFSGYVSVKDTEWDELMVEGRPSTVAYMEEGKPLTITFAEPVDLEGYWALSMVARSFRLESDAMNSPYTFTVNGLHKYKCPISKGMRRMVMPITDDVTRLETLTVELDRGMDTLVMAHLIAMAPELPSDLLRGFKRGIEGEVLRKGNPFIIGSVDCFAGDTQVILEGSSDFLERNVVVRIGDELHQVANKVDNRVSFLSTYDGESVKADYSGYVYVTLPVDIGYYDREAALPGIALWYNSPKPTERHSLTDYSVLCTIDGLPVEERSGSTMEWRVTVEVAARSPQLVQMAARCVRAYLAHSECWVNNVKLWWVWKDPVVDSEPVADYDVVPRANYHVGVEVQEDVWELANVDTFKDRNIRVRGVRHG